MAILLELQWMCETWQFQCRKLSFIEVRDLMHWISGPVALVTYPVAIELEIGNSDIKFLYIGPKLIKTGKTIKQCSCNSNSYIFCMTICKIIQIDHHDNWILKNSIFFLEILCTSQCQLIIPCSVVYILVK